MELNTSPGSASEINKIKREERHLAQISHYYSRRFAGRAFFVRRAEGEVPSSDKIYFLIDSMNGGGTNSAPRVPHSNIHIKQTQSGKS
jgi:hypothetical protein